ncbi:MAG: nicotinate phosphoribosyltransferase [Chloroflexota bacterium]|nr:nicotinate phosphoribosyltransferase [Chloroflexota bacterium]MDE2941965.1 nicotinate phosphoribosyltransferase [Chloroflexota bacterium]MDE3267063.1 nicotinate phosphoribosyltransferase [Chloroflexota bacterium]
MADPEFEVRPSVQIGDTADVRLHRGLTVLRSEGVNPVVTVEFSAEGRGIFCGIREVKALLQRVLPEASRDAWALEEGDTVSAGEVALRVTAPYGTLALYETAICGTLSHCTGWATASHECVTAAGGIPVISTGARYVHPGVAGVMDYAATVGGCVSCSTPIGSKLAGTTPASSISPDVVLIFGDSLRAMQAFDRHLPQEVSRVAPVNVMKDEAEEAIALARSLRLRLRGVVLDAMRTHDEVSPHMVKEVRARLDQAGFSHVEIFVSGELGSSQLRAFVESGAPVTAFEVGGYISCAPPIGFRADIHEVDGRPMARRGQIPGVTENSRLVELI